MNSFFVETGSHLGRLSNVSAIHKPKPCADLQIIRVKFYKFSFSIYGTAGSPLLWSWHNHWQMREECCRWHLPTVHELFHLKIDLEFKKIWNQEKWMWVWKWKCKLWQNGISNLMNNKVTLNQWFNTFFILLNFGLPKVVTVIVQFANRPF